MNEPSLRASSQFCYTDTMRDSTPSAARRWKTLAAILGLTALLYFPLGYAVQNALIFPGAGTFSAGRTAPEPPAPITGQFLTTADGASIDLWKLAAPAARKAVLFLHGNGNSLLRTVGQLELLRSYGFSAYAIDYRGYGRSSGWPTESGIYEDAETAWRYLTQHEGFAESDIALLGHSLGTAPASYLAAEHHPAALFLIAPFTSIPDVAASRPIVNYLRPLIWIVFPTRRFVQKLSGTCLSIFAAEGDAVVPVEQSKSVAAVQPQTRLRLYPGGDHFSVLWSALKDLPFEAARCIPDLRPPVS